jgi:hypothetical protein
MLSKQQPTQRGGLEGMVVQTWNASYYSQVSENKHFFHTSKINITDSAKHETLIK